MTQSRRFWPAQVLARERAGGGLTRVVVEPPPFLVPTYEHLGQYIEVKAGDENGFFVLSSEPRAAPWELIMRAGGGASDVILAADSNPSIELSGALGHGFPAEDVVGRHLVVTLNGTGVAAGPPLVRRRIRDGDAAVTKVFFGVRTRDELPMEGELVAWCRAGVGVVVCLSQAPVDIHGRAERAEDSGLRFVQGYVQDVLSDKLAPGFLADGHVFAVGTSSMVEAIRQRAPALGLDIERIHTNY